MASITSRLRADGSRAWRVQFRIDGRMCQESFSTEKAAKEFGLLVDTQGGGYARTILSRRQDTTTGTPTFRTWCETYLDETSGILTGIEPATRANYRRIIEQTMIPMLGDIPLDVVTRQDIGKWVAWQEAQPSKINPSKTISAKTVQNHHAVLSSVFKSAIEHGLISTNPAYKTKLTKGRKAEAVFLSRDEFSTLLYFTPIEFQPFLLFLAGTGCRWSEATALTWGDLTLTGDQPTIRIDKAWKKSVQGAPTVKHPKSSRAYRTISIWPELVNALGTPGRSDQLIFQNSKGSAIWHGRFTNSVWKPAVEKAMDVDLCADRGLTPIMKRPTIHSLRHTHASWLIASGTPLPHIQNRLGHESITTTVEVYGHLMPDAHSNMASAMQTVLGKALDPNIIKA